MHTLERFLKALVDLIVGIAMVLLGLRFVLKLFGANSTNDFVSWVYDTSGEILDPFRNIFEPITRDGFVIEFSTLFAMLIYGLIGMLAYYLIEVLTPKPKTRKK